MLRITEDLMTRYSSGWYGEYFDKNFDKYDWTNCTYTIAYTGIPFDTVRPLKLVIRHKDFPYIKSYMFVGRIPSKLWFHTMDWEEFRRRFYFHVNGYSYTIKFYK